MRTTLLAAGLVAAAACSNLACVTQAVLSPMIVPVPLLTGAAPSVSISGDVHVLEGETHHGDLVVIMGDARVDGEVTGQVVVVLGKLEMNGTAQDQVVSVLSETRIGPEARIGGDLVNVGWLMKREAGSQVGGEVINISFMQFMPFFHEAGGLGGLVCFIVFVQLTILASFFLAILLVTALIPRRLERIASALPEKWGWALLTGVLAYAGSAVAGIILFFTFIGIPLALALCFAMKVIKWVGLASIFLLIGQNLGRNLFKRELSHLPAVLGGFVIYAILWLIPLFGWAVTLFLDFLAVGIVLLTKFGSDEPWGQPQPSGGLPPQQPGSEPPPSQSLTPPAEPPVVPSGSSPGGPPGSPPGTRSDSPSGS